MPNLKASSAAVLLSLLSTALAANHDIKVGPQYIFSPNTTVAAAGDTLTFHFDPDRHDIVQGTFDKPCTFKSDGFYSGLNAQVPSGDDTFVVTVNDSSPLWFYCSVPGHCQSGMVGVVNPPKSGDTLAAYANAANDVSDSTAPSKVAGGVLQSGSVASASASASSAASSSASSAASSSASAASASASSAASSASAAASHSGASHTTSAASASGTSATASAATPATSTGAARSLSGNADGFSALGAVFAMLGAAIAGMV